MSTVEVNESATFNAEAIKARAANGPGRDIKPRLNRRQYIEALWRMTPQQRWDKGFELTAHSRDLFETGMRQRFSHLGEDKLKALMLKPLAKWHNRNW